MKEVCCWSPNADQRARGPCGLVQQAYTQGIFAQEIKYVARGDSGNCRKAQHGGPHVGGRWIPG